MKNKMRKLVKAEEVPEGEIVGITLPDGKQLAIYNVRGEFYVTDDRCTHGEALLSEDGELDDCIVECSWHFGAFDITTGEAKAMPCTQALRTYQSELREGWVVAEVSTGGSSESATIASENL